MYYLGTLQWRVGYPPRDSYIAAADPKTVAQRIYDAWRAVPANAIYAVDGFTLRRAKSNRVEHIPTHLQVKMIDEGAFEVWLRSNTPNGIQFMGMPFTYVKLAEFSVHWLDGPKTVNPWHREPIFNRAPDDPRPEIYSVRKANAIANCRICQKNKGKPEREWKPCKDHQHAHVYELAIKREAKREARSISKREARIAANRALKAKKAHKERTHATGKDYLPSDPEYATAFDALRNLIGEERANRYHGYPLSIEGKVRLRGDTE